MLAGKETILDQIRNNNTRMIERRLTAKLMGGKGGGGGHDMKGGEKKTPQSRRLGLTAITSEVEEKRQEHA